MLRKIFSEFLKLIASRFTFFRSVEGYVSHKFILLIDDEIDFCDLIRQTLEREGFKVIIGHTFKLAKAQLDTYDPSIIVISLILADGTGTEFIIKNKSQLEFKRIIVIGSDFPPASMENLKGLGVFGFLSKPFNPSVLSKMIYQAAFF
jgi:two-component system, NtrC family, response regulator HydG